MLRRETAISSLLLLLVDVLGFYGSVTVSKYLRVGQWDLTFNLPFVLITVLTVLIFYISNLYGLSRETRITSAFSRVVLATLISSVTAASFIYMTRSFEFDLLFWRSVFIFAMTGFFFWAIGVRYLMIRYLRRSRVSNWFVIGDQSVLDTIAEALPSLEHTLKLTRLSESEYVNDFNFNTLDIDDSDLGGIVIGRERVLNPVLSNKLLKDRLAGCKVWGTEDFIESYGAKIPVSYLQDNWLVMTSGFQIVHQSVPLRVKRVFDITISLLGLMLALPIMLLAAIAVKIGDGQHILFSQERTGKDGKPFVMYKFRTMIVNAEAGGAIWASENDSRITKIGLFLRRTRIDELPQLWNVFIGNMSFVGPRPERPEFNIKLEKEIPYYDIRHIVKPGMTGWAQVLYPYGASVEDALRKLEYDIYYIKNYSLALDLFIILRTIKVVISRSGR